MRNSAIHVSFVIGISLFPLTGLAGETLPVPNAVFQYLDDADFECSKEQPLHGIIVSSAVPLKNWTGQIVYQGDVSRNYVIVRRGGDIMRVEIAPESADYTNRIEPKAIDDAVFTIEYSAQVCTGFVGSTVVGGAWSISGESEEHNFSAKGDFSEPAVKINLMWSASDVRSTYPANGLIYTGYFLRDIETKIYLNEIDVSVVEKTAFHRRFEESLTGRFSQKIEFRPDEPLSNDNTNQSNTSLPIRKE